MWRIRAIVLVTVLLLVLNVGADAAMTAATVTCDLSFSGSNANCSATVKDSGKSITATMELWCGSFPLALWSDTDTSRVDLEGSLTVASGMTYTLIVYGTINGVSFAAEPIVRPY